MFVTLGQLTDLKSKAILTQLITKLLRHKQEQWGAIEYYLYQHTRPRVADINDCTAFLDCTLGIEETLSFKPQEHLGKPEKRSACLSSKPVKIPYPRTQPTIFAT